MKNSKLKYKLLFVAALIFFISGCGEMFDNPLKDKETGEDINLLIVDFNFFTTRMNFRFADIETGNPITNEVSISFSGENANDIVDFSGKKNNIYSTSESQIELTIDPNVEINQSTPFNYAVHVAVEGYESFTRGIQINSEGKKTYEILLSPESTDEETTLTGTEEDGSFVFSFAPNTKSGSLEDKTYEIKYKIAPDDLIKFVDYYDHPMFSSVEEAMAAYQSDPANFLKMNIIRKTDFPMVIDRLYENGTEKMVLFNKLETGEFKELVVTGRRVADLRGGSIEQVAANLAAPEPDVFGFVKFENAGWKVLGTALSHQSLVFSYTLASASLDPLCPSGASIRFASNAKSSFSIDADIFDLAGNLIETTNFKGTFPESFTLENIPNVAAKIVFRNNNPGFKDIAPLEVSSLCSGSYEVEVDPADGFMEYQVVLKAFCKDNPSVALAPTYSGEIRIKNSNDPWQGIDMEGGVADVLAKENETYQIRFLWKENWETTEFRTEFDASGNYVNPSGSKVTSSYLDDGRIKMIIEHTFEQDVCNDLGW